MVTVAPLVEEWDVVRKTGQSSTLLTCTASSRLGLVTTMHADPLTALAGQLHPWLAATDLILMHLE